LTTILTTAVMGFILLTYLSYGYVSGLLPLSYSTHDRNCSSTYPVMPSLFIGTASGNELIVTRPLSEARNQYRKHILLQRHLSATKATFISELFRPMDPVSIKVILVGNNGNVTSICGKEYLVQGIWCLSLKKEHLRSTLLYIGFTRYYPANSRKGYNVIVVLKKHLGIYDRPTEHPSWLTRDISNHSSIYILQLHIYK
jgi:hypothetical protein